MKIYTKTGDDGETGLFGGPRVRKDSARIEACGSIDELNAALGVVRAVGVPAEVDGAIGRVQHQLFDLGAELAAPDPAKYGGPSIVASAVTSLEMEIDAWESRLAPLKQFILPGGVASAAQIHLARTICRRGERRVVSLASQDESPVSPVILAYLNRLSDWLFVLARIVNQSSGAADTPWLPGR